MTNRFSEYLFVESLAGNANTVSSTLLTYKFANLVRRKFVDWDAYRLGLIDRQGNIVKVPRTPSEIRSFGMFENLVRKLKKAIARYVGDSDIVSHLISLYLVKKESRDSNEEFVKQEIAEELDNDEIVMLEKILMGLKENKP